VAQGVYRPDRGIGLMPGDRTATFRLISGVAIKGGYAGFGKPDPNARDIVKYETILSGDLDGNDVAVSDPCDLPSEPTRAENSYHVVTGSGTDATAIIDGLTITGGNDDRYECPYPYDPNFCIPIGSGGGMFNKNGSPTVRDCTFRANSATRNGFHSEKSFGGGMSNENNSNPVIINCSFTENFSYMGGGMYNYDSRPALDNCTFTANSVRQMGGAVCNIISSPVLTNCTFSSNLAYMGAGVYNGWGSPILTNCTFSKNPARSGGGIYNEGSRATLRDCIFDENSASRGGGAIFIYDCSPTVTGCTFNTNSARDGGAVGSDTGGNYNAPVLIDCLFIGNSASRNGGAIYNMSSVGGSLNPMVGDCSFINNLATTSGGAIYNTSSTGGTTASTVSNCLFAGNSAAVGGGAMYNDSSTGATTKVTVLNCTSANNSAAIGGGMYNKREAGSPGTVAITVTNCILWADSPDEIINENNPIVTVIYSDIKGGWAGCGNIDIDPCFADPCNYDYHLKSQAGRWNPDSQTWVKDAVTSPCIDKGDPSSDWTKELWPHGKRINMGAYGGTSQASMSLSDAGNIADLDNNGWVDCNDLKLFTGKWLYEVFLLPEDLDRDGRTNFEDFAIFANNWLFPSE